MSSAAGHSSGGKSGNRTASKNLQQQQNRRLSFGTASTSTPPTNSSATNAKQAKKKKQPNPALTAANRALSEAAIGELLALDTGMDVDQGGTASRKRVEPASSPEGGDVEEGKRPAKKDYSTIAFNDLGNPDMRLLKTFNLPRNNTARYHPAAIPLETAGRIFETCIRELLPKATRHSTRLVDGRQAPEPRKILWYGPDYTYSGGKLPANQSWPTMLTTIRAWLTTEFGLPSFNSVLLNFYEDGRDSIGWHSDSEPELGDNPIIASLSFGAVRTFMIARTCVGGG